MIVLLDRRNVKSFSLVAAENLQLHHPVSYTHLSSLKNRFYTAVPAIRQDIMSALKRKGIYLLDPESANGYSVGAAILILAPFGIFQYMGWANFFNSAALLVPSVLLSALIWFLFARVMLSLIHI